MTSDLTSIFISYDGVYFNIREVTHCGNDMTVHIQQGVQGPLVRIQIAVHVLSIPVRAHVPLAV